jgi:hypothetical protein
VRSTVALQRLRRSKTNDHCGDFKNSLVEGLFALLNSRLDELTNSATPPLLMVIPIMVGLCKNQKGYQSVAMSQEDKQQR